MSHLKKLKKATHATVLSSMTKRATSPQVQNFRNTLAAPVGIDKMKRSESKASERKLTRKKSVGK